MCVYGFVGMCVCGCVCTCMWICVYMDLWVCVCGFVYVAVVWISCCQFEVITYFPQLTDSGYLICELPLYLLFD